MLGYWVSSRCVSPYERYMFQGMMTATSAQAAEPPAKLHDDPASKMAWVCNYCPAFAQCHGGQFAPRSCRTCIHSTPVDGGWHCEHHGALDAEAQRKGCSLHLYIPALVPGEQIDADPETGTVTYRMADGATWIDGGAA